MTDQHAKDAAIYALLCQWIALRDDGNDIPITILCREHPSLQTELERCIRILDEATTFPQMIPPEVSVSHRTPTFYSDTAQIGLKELNLGTDRFIIRREIGRGGMGVVYEAEDTRWGENVALKTLTQPSLAMLAYLKREFRSLADLTHPNLVTLYELHSIGSRWFFTMELLQGDDFLSYVRPSGGQLDLARVERCLIQLILGLTVLHERGIVHRDIKPSNVFVAENERVVLLDFGLAIRVSNAGPLSALAPYLVGTPEYVAPEMVQLRPASPASDWYAVGVILFQAITGHRLFSGLAEKALEAKLRSPAPDPAQFTTGIPEAWLKITRRLLSREPQDRPLGKEILATFSQTPVTAARMISPSIPFIGRRDILQNLDDALEQVLNGRTVLRFLQGISGIGKSSILEHFLQKCARSMAVVLEGRCHEQESVPFNAFDEISEQLSSWLESLPENKLAELLPKNYHVLSRVFPSFCRTLKSDTTTFWEARTAEESNDLRHSFFLAFRELLKRIGEKHELVIAIDDLQWGDPDSISLLSEILCLADPPKLLFLGTYRTESLENSPMVRGIRSFQFPPGSTIDYQELAIEPLGPQDAKLLFEASVVSSYKHDSQLLDLILADSHGHPYLIHEMAQQLNFPYAGRNEDSTSLLDDYIAHQLNRLDPDCLRLLEFVAIAGYPIEQDVLQHTCDWKGESWQRTLKRMRSGFLIRLCGVHDNQRIILFHDRIRKVILCRMSPDQVRCCHVRIAETLNVLKSSEVEALAIHYEAAGLIEQATIFALQAADQAFQALAFDRASQFYEKVLRLTPLSPDDEKNIRIHLAESYAGAGDGVTAAEQFLIAEHLAPPQESIELRIRACQLMSAVGRFEEAWQGYVEIFRDTGYHLLSEYFDENTDGSVHRLKHVHLADDRKLLLLWVAASVVWAWDLVKGYELFVKFREEAHKSNDPEFIALALGNTAGWNVTTSLDYTSVQGLMDEAFRKATKVESPYVLGFLHYFQGWIHLWHGQWDDAISEADRADSYWKRSADGMLGRNWNWSNVVTALFLRGRIAEIGRRLWPILRDAQERGDVFRSTTAPIPFGIIAWLMLDESSKAREVLNTSLNYWSTRRDLLIEWFFLNGQILVELYEQNGNLARNLILSKRDVLDAMCSWNLPVRVLSLNIEGQAMLAMGLNLESARDEVMAIILRLRDEPLPFAPMLSKLLDAGLALAQKKYEEAYSKYLSAELGFKSISMDLHAVAARRARGLLLGTNEGKLLVENADEWLRQQGVRNPERFASMVAPGIMIVTDRLEDC